MTAKGNTLLIAILIAMTVVASMISVTDAAYTQRGLSGSILCPELEVKLNDRTTLYWDFGKSK